MKKIDLLFFNNGEMKEPGVPSEALCHIISSIDAIANLNNLSCFIIDFDEHSLIYRTEKLIYMNEVSHKDRKRVCSVPYWEVISDDTLDLLLSISHNYLTLNHDLPREEYRQHICIIDYPILINGKEIYINQRFTPLILRDDGIAKVGLFAVENSNQKSFNSFIITPSGKRWKYDVENKQFVEFELGSTLSLVEKAILYRAKKGMTSEEIANDIYISVNTVKTHRLRIFNKLGVHSLQEALSVVVNYKLV